MSQIRSAILAGALMTSLSLSGCGDENSQAVYNSESGGTHPTGWMTNHKTSARAKPEGCGECHGEDLTGGISRVSCTSPTAVNGFRCHASSPAENPTGCISCHGGPATGPNGTTAPNRQFAHYKHVLLTGCSTCHLNAGAGTVSHGKATPTGGISSAKIDFSPGFKAKTTPNGFVYANGKCSGTNCHGGQDTPEWTASINMATDCQKCHELGTSQYNSYYSGQKSGTNLHERHLSAGIFCTDCHNIGTLTNYQQHFGGITTNTFTAPGKTVGGPPTKIGSYGQTTQTCSAIICHPDTQWNQ